MSYILAAPNPQDGREHFWCGGDKWSLQPNEAAQFSCHAYAQSTLHLIASTEIIDTWKQDAEPVQWPEDELPDTPEFPD